MKLTADDVPDYLVRVLRCIYGTFGYRLRDGDVTVVHTERLPSLELAGWHGPDLRPDADQFRTTLGYIEPGGPTIEFFITDKFFYVNVRGRAGCEFTWTSALLMDYDDAKSCDALASLVDEAEMLFDKYIDWWI